MTNRITRAGRERAEYEKLLVSSEDGLLLKNKWGIKDIAKLNKAERLWVSNQIASEFPKGADFKSFHGLQKIHKHLFGEIYDWAGKIRQHTTARGPAPFARPDYIQSEATKLFKSIREQDYFAGLPKRKFAAKVAESVNELNAIHPFVDGNGRVQRVWLAQICKNAGYRFRIKPNDRKQWNEASKQGFQAVNHKPMQKLVSERLKGRGLSRISTERSQSPQNKKSPKRSRA